MTPEHCIFSFRCPAVGWVCGRSLLVAHSECVLQFNGVCFVSNDGAVLQSVYSSAHISAIASIPPQERSYLDVSKLASELSRVPLLQKLDNSSLRKLATEVHLEVHLPGSVVMRQTDFGDRMFLLTEGSVHVMKIPDDEMAIVRNLGTWPDAVEPLLKDTVQVLFQTFSCIVQLVNHRITQF